MFPYSIILNITKRLYSREVGERISFHKICSMQSKAICMSGRLLYVAECFWLISFSVFGSSEVLVLPLFIAGRTKWLILMAPYSFFLFSFSLIRFLFSYKGLSLKFACGLEKKITPLKYSDTNTPPPLTSDYYISSWIKTFNLQRLVDGALWWRCTFVTDNFPHRREQKLPSLPSYFSLLSCSSPVGRK